MFPEINEQMDLIKDNIVDLLPEDELVKKLEKSRKSSTPLIIKLGCDPSRPDLHLGHSVVLDKMRQFQDLGHRVVLIVGDFTGMIGDPSGKNKTRPALSLDETRENGRSYFEQASKILDAEKVKIVYNSEWLGKMNFEEVIRLASKYTIARMIERDDFKSRYKKGEPISVHEFLYPLAQAMDSVAIQSDVEIGGTDQKFNLLVGRDVQREYGQEPQVILTLPILPGTDGAQKMSKSLNNYIGIAESPKEIYGKILSIPDTAIYVYFQLTTHVSVEALKDIKNKLGDPTQNPRDIKRRLARTLVAQYYSEREAMRAEQAFDKIYVNKEIPDDIKEFTPNTAKKSIWIVKLMTTTKMSTTNSQARRLITENAVSLNNKKITDINFEVPLDKPLVLKVGKHRFVKITPKSLT